MSKQGILMRVIGTSINADLGLAIETRFQELAQTRCKSQEEFDLALDVICEEIASDLGLNYERTADDVAIFSPELMQ